MSALVVVVVMRLRWRIIPGAVLSLVGFVGTQWFVVGTLDYGMVEPREIRLYVLAATGVGALVVVALDRQLHHTALIAVASSLVCATLSVSRPFLSQPGTPLFILALGIAVGSLEATARYPAVQQFLTTGRERSPSLSARSTFASGSG